MSVAPRRACRRSAATAGALLLGAAMGCSQPAALPSAPIAAPTNAPSTTIQHDNPSAPTSPPNAGRGAPEPQTEPLPPGHPKLGDGAQTHDADPAQLPPGHPAISDQMDSKTLLAQVEAMKDQLKDRPKTVEILLALGSLYYDNERYLDAVDYYRQAEDKGQVAVDLLELEQKKAAGKPLPSAHDAGCDHGQAGEFDRVLAKAQEYAAQGDHPRAAACAAEAVKPVVVAHARRGNSFYLIGNSTSAVAEHDRALALDPTFAESLFFRGAIIFDTMGDDVPKLKTAEANWKEFLAVAGDHPRADSVRQMLPQLQQAIALGGASKLPQKAASSPHGGGGGMAPALNQGEMDAVQNTEITPDVVTGMEAIMTETIPAVAKGDAATAGANMKRVFPFVMSQPDKFKPEFKARAMALMGLYMASKGAPMAQGLLGQAADADPAAVDHLADEIQKQGGAAPARTLWTLLTTQVPDYSAKANVGAKIH